MRTRQEFRLPETDTLKFLWGEFLFVLLFLFTLTSWCKEDPSFPDCSTNLHQPLLCPWPIGGLRSSLTLQSLLMWPIWPQVQHLLGRFCVLFIFLNLLNLYYWPREWSTHWGRHIGTLIWYDICTRALKFCSSVAVATAPCNVLGCSLKILFFTKWNNCLHILSIIRVHTWVQYSSVKHTMLIVAISSSLGAVN